jgi:hypothetical protein
LISEVSFRFIGFLVAGTQILQVWASFDTKKQWITRVINSAGIETWFVVDIVRTRLAAYVGFFHECACIMTKGGLDGFAGVVLIAVQRLARVISPFLVIQSS